MGEDKDPKTSIVATIKLGETLRFLNSGIGTYGIMYNGMPSQTSFGITECMNEYRPTVYYPLTTKQISVAHGVIPDSEELLKAHNYSGRGVGHNFDLPEISGTALVKEVIPTQITLEFLVGSIRTSNDMGYTYPTPSKAAQRTLAKIKERDKQPQ